MTIHVNNSLIAVGCNPLCGVMAWAPTGLVAYGADQSIALFSLPSTEQKSNATINPCGRGVFATLHGHKERVNAVSFILDDNKRVESIVSAAADNTIRIWQRVDITSDAEWKCTSILDKHTASVTTIAILPSSYGVERAHILASAASDGTIGISTIDHRGVGQPLQTIHVGARYATALALAQLPGTQTPILVSAGTDFRISLYTLQNDEFVRKLQLQGHSDWIRDLQFVCVDSTDIPELLLASASQDRYIRLWRLASLMAESSSSSSSSKIMDKDQESDAMDSLLDTLRNTTMEGDGAQLSTEAFLFELANSSETDSKPLRFSVMLEAVLQGHDDWVYSVHWHPRILNSEGKLVQPMRLLSASADKSAILWAPDEATGVWLPQSRVGDIGGTSLGYYGALFNVDGSSILAHDYHGAFHLWSRVTTEQDRIEQWNPQVCVGGHFKSVQGLVWHPKGQYILSTSLDQTTRLFGPWIKNDTQLGWYEMARPQVHGYDLQCATFTGDYQFASGADEKVVRVFDAPASFVRSLAALTEQSELLSDAGSRPAAANLPPLGLSNKAVESHDDNVVDEEGQDEMDELTDQGAFRGQSYALSRVPGSSDELPERPPLDEQLQQLTLWPETEKLYGHVFEIIAIAASHDGRFLATACRATGPEHAVVRLFDTKTWKELPGKLASHSLTITKIRFSPDDRFLLTVSRDRSWTLFSRTDNDQAPYQLETKGVKAHSRIIWDATWSQDGRYFATASRDKTIKIWQLTKSNDSANVVCQAVATLQCEHSVTSIDFAPIPTGTTSHSYLLAVGLEDGSILFYQSTGNIQEWQEIGRVTSSLSHASTVQELLWRRSNDTILQLASCGQDHSVRLFNITLD
ncbi:WD40-repeat-containing domain protein [Syncephalis plumigaleata]|nr:WD40-repeat-containing domain protein [Syncephalis plumigaleata]